MSLAAKLFITAVVGTGMLFTATVGAGVAMVRGAGFIDVVVQEADGQRIHVAAPAILANLALAAVPTDVVATELANIEMPADAPSPDEVFSVVGQMTEEFANSPDFTLVEVKDGDDHVLIEKRRKALVISVEGRRGEQVRISVPIKTVRRVGKMLDRV